MSNGEGVGKFFRCKNFIAVLNFKLLVDVVDGDIGPTYMI